MGYLLIGIGVFIIFYAICKLNDPTITAKDVVHIIRDFFKSGPTSEELQNARHKSYLPMLESSPLYHTGFARALVGAVRSNAPACALARPVDVTNHLAQLGQGVILDENGNLFFCYRFERSVVCPGGGKIEYSTLPAQDMTNILNKALPNYCVQNGVWALHIADQKDAGLGFVNFYIRPFSNWNDVEIYLRSEGCII